MTVYANAKSKTVVYHVVDKWNKAKVWVIKQYTCGHYHVNQLIDGAAVYKTFKRTSMQHLKQIGVFA